MKLYIIPVMILILFYGCVAPQPVAKLKVADDEKVTWKLGSEVVNLKYKDIYLEVGFLECWKDYLVFFVTVTNNSRYTYLVDPSKFYFTADSNFNEKAIRYNSNSSINTLSYKAVDPEQHLNYIDGNIARTVSEQKNSLLTYIAGEVITTVAETAIESSDKNKNDEERERRSIERENRHADRYNAYVDNNINREIHITNLEEERTYWANKTLRKTTLAPGYEIGGLVFFNRNNDMKKLTINFKIENIDNIISYYQTLIRP